MSLSNLSISFHENHYFKYSSDYSGFLSRRIQSNDLIKNSYSELFGFSNPNSINVKAFIFGENGIQYLGIE